jgi:hypothetical protein
MSARQNGMASPKYHGIISYIMTHQNIVAHQVSRIATYVGSTKYHGSSTIPTHQLSRAAAYVGL